MAQGPHALHFLASYAVGLKAGKPGAPMSDYPLRIHYHRDGNAIGFGGIAVLECNSLDAVEHKSGPQILFHIAHVDIVQLDPVGMPDEESVRGPGASRFCSCHFQFNAARPVIGPPLAAPGDRAPAGRPMGNCGSSGEQHEPPFWAEVEPRVPHYGTQRHTNRGCTTLAGRLITSKFKLLQPVPRLSAVRISKRECRL